MKIKTSTKSTDFELVHISEGIYVAELKEIKPIKEGTYGSRVAFIYKIIDKDCELAMICYHPEMATANNRFGQTLVAHGIEIKDDQEIETDNLIGTKVRVWVEDYEREIEVNGKKSKEIGSSISKVKPLEEKSC